MQSDKTDPNPNDPATLMPVLQHINDEDEVEPLMPPTPPNLDITTSPVPRPLCCSSRVPIPTEQNPTGGPSTTHTEAAVQESKESAACVKEMHQECRATKHTGSKDDRLETSADGNDIIDGLQLAFENLDLGDQAHNLLAMISEMTDFDPESLQFEDEPKTWDEVKNSVDAACWEAGYKDELESLKDMGVYKLIPQSEVPQGKCI